MSKDKRPKNNGNDNNNNNNNNDNDNYDNDNENYDNENYDSENYDDENYDDTSEDYTDNEDYYDNENHSDNEEYYDNENYDGDVDYDYIDEEEELRYELSERPSHSRMSAKGAHKKPLKKPQFAMFYIITLCVAVVICIVIFAVVFSNIVNDRSGDDKGKQSPSPPPEQTQVAVNEKLQTTGVIVDVSEGVVDVRDVLSDEVYSLKTSSETTMVDEYGQDMSLADFKTGDIVSVEFNTKTQILDDLQISPDPQVWESKMIKNVVVEPENQTMTINNKTYIYDQNLIAVSGSNPVDISEVSPADIVTVSGFGDKALYVEIEKGHGFINLMGTDKIKEGVLEVDTDMYMPLSEITEPVEISKGHHKVVVKGLNIEPFTKEVEVLEGATIDMDLTQAKFKTGVVNVNANVSDYTIKINGEQKPTDEPIILDYGNYTVEVSKDGYAPWIKEISLDAPNLDLNAELKEMVLLCNLTITTEPAGADIYIDNGFVGSSPTGAQVTYGEHFVTVVKDGYNDVTIRLDLTKEQEGYNITMVEKQPPPPPTPPSNVTGDGQPEG